MDGVTTLPQKLVPAAEEVDQDVGLPRQVPRFQLDSVGLRPSEKLPCQRAKGIGDRAPLLVDIGNHCRIVTHRSHSVVHD